MTNKRENQFTEYLVREVARRIVPMALDATGDTDCLKQAKKLRKLAYDASMTEIKEVCDASYEVARAARAASASYCADRAANAAYSVDAEAAADATIAADAAWATGVAHSTCVTAGAHSTYSDILLEVAKRMPANAVPIIPDLHRKMYEAVTLPGQSLEMEAWHTCKTTHCRAGWAVVLGGAAGKALEKAFGPAVAGGLIYVVNTGMVPDFFNTNNESVMDDMKLAAQAS